MTVREVIRGALLNPTIWQALLLVEWFGLGWLVSLALPGDPATDATWVKVVLAVPWFGGITAFNYLLRRRLLQ